MVGKPMGLLAFQTTEHPIILASRSTLISFYHKLTLIIGPPCLGWPEALQQGDWLYLWRDTGPSE